MESFDTKLLRSRGKEALSQAKTSLKKLILIYAGVIMAVGMVLSLLDYILTQSIHGTGGLEDIGVRTVLQTAQTLLQLAYLAVTPFWSIGLIGAMLHISRREPTGPGSLLEGFTHWGVVLRTNLLKLVIWFAVLMLGVQVGTTVYMMTPLAAPMYELAEQMMASGVTDPSELTDPQALYDIAMGMLPMVMGICLLIALPVYYRTRLMDYVVMDMPRRGAFFGLRMSLFMTRKKGLQLFKLDLSFWWFYLLELLTVALSYGDWILPLTGVSLGENGTLWGIVFSLLGMGAQLGLYVWKKDLLEATWASAYEALLPPPIPQE